MSGGEIERRLAKALEDEGEEHQRRIEELEDGVPSEPSAEQGELEREWLSEHFVEIGENDDGDIFVMAHGVESHAIGVGDTIAEALHNAGAPDASPSPPVEESKHKPFSARPKHDPLPTLVALSETVQELEALREALEDARGFLGGSFDAIENRRMGRLRQRIDALLASPQEEIDEIPQND